MSRPLQTLNEPELNDWERLAAFSFFHRPPESCQICSFLSAAVLIRVAACRRISSFRSSASPQKRRRAIMYSYTVNRYCSYSAPQWPRLTGERPALMNRQMATLVDLAYKLPDVWPHSASERRSAHEGHWSSVVSSLLGKHRRDRVEEQSSLVW